MYLKTRCVCQYPYEMALSDDLAVNIYEEPSELGDATSRLNLLVGSALCLPAGARGS